jgi:hypothetical protein
MRNRSGYMINPLTGRQVKMNGNVAKNVFRMVGGASASEESSAPLGVHLDQAQQQLSQQTVAMEASLNEQKSQTDTSPFCTFERLEKSLTAEDKEKLKSDEGKKLFDEVTGLIGSVSNIVSTTVNYLGLFSSENRGRRAAPVQQNVNQNENLTMLGGGRRKQRRSSQKKRNNK